MHSILYIKYYHVLAVVSHILFLVIAEVCCHRRRVRFFLLVIPDATGCKDIFSHDGFPITVAKCISHKSSICISKWKLSLHSTDSVICIYRQRQTDSFNVSRESIMPSYSLSNKGMHIFLAPLFTMFLNFHHHTLHANTMITLLNTVHSVKVISSKKWFVAGTSDGVIHVYNYDNKIQKLRSFRAASDCFITSMAVHPTSPYVLSSAHRDIKLWDWSKSWVCTQSFVQEHSDTIGQVSFNPNGTNTFASASDDHTVKVYMGFSFLLSLATGAVGVCIV